MKSDFIQVYTTTPDRETAEIIAKELVFKSRLAACVQISGEIESFFTWQSSDCRRTEYVCIIKTVSDCFERVEQKIKSLHPYKVPEIVAVPLTAVSSDYSAWYEAMIRNE